MSDQRLVQAIVGEADAPSTPFDVAFHGVGLAGSDGRHDFLGASAEPIPIFINKGEDDAVVLLKCLFSN
jgi:hypothetical protein